MPFLSENTNLSITSLLPPRWIFILSTNLMDLQVDAEFEVAREEEKDQNSEEDETEL